MRGTHGWAEVSRERKREIIAAIASGKATRGPVHAELDLTDRCNVACYFCNQQDVRTKEQIPIGRAIDLIDELADGGLKSVRLSGGGDPLMHREILQVLDHLEKRGVVVDNLTTNGALLVPAIADRLVERKAREVIFSLNSPDAEDYRRMMQVGPSVFDRVLANIRNLVARRGDSPFPSVVVQFLVDRNNMDSLGRMYELGRSLGPDRIAVNLVLEIPRERVDPSLVLRPEDAGRIRPLLEEVFRADADAGLLQVFFPYPNWNEMLREIKEAVSYPEPENLFPIASTFREENGHCFFGWYTAAVRGNGDLYPCCLLLNPDYKPLGNTLNGKFMDQWNGPVFGQLRKEMREVFLEERPKWDPERFQVLAQPCVEPHMCFLKNMYFRADEEFYRELDEALRRPRARHRRIAGLREMGRRTRRAMRRSSHAIRRWISPAASGGV
jgi:MoaA/NifB/PqqE/SkfB family radical SAM enzyme